MPLLIRSIESIATQVKRGVLYVRFPALDNLPAAWRKSESRQQFIDWLDTNEIEWELCGESWRNKGYRGQIYLNIHFSPELASYQQLESKINQTSVTEIELCYMSLACAKKLQKKEFL